MMFCLMLMIRGLLVRLMAAGWPSSFFRKRNQNSCGFPRCLLPPASSQFPHQRSRAGALLPPALDVPRFGKQANALFLARGLLMEKFFAALREATNLRRYSYW